MNYEALINQKFYLVKKYLLASTNVWNKNVCRQKRKL